MAKKQNLLIVTAVWGSWHMKIFHELNLATLLAPGNLPALSSMYNIDYVFFTSAADLRALADHPAMGELGDYVSIEYETLSAKVLADPIAAHHNAWDRATKMARISDRKLLLMPPDVVWADNSFRSVGRKLRNGIDHVFMTYLRAESESFEAAIYKMKQKSETTLIVPPQRLVKMCIDHLHPLMAASLANSDFFPVHAEMALWAVPKEGVIVRVFARELFLFDPRTMPVTPQKLPLNPLSPSKAAFMDDSEELFAVSLAELDKDSDWYQQANRADPTKIAKWWLVYDSPGNDFNVGHNIRWHQTDITESKWRQKELLANIFVRRTLAQRDGIRLWTLADRFKFRTTADLINIAVETGVIAHAARGRHNCIILLPSNEAMEQISSKAINLMHTDQGMRALSKFIRAHVVPLDVDYIEETDPIQRLVRKRVTEITYRNDTYKISEASDGKFRSINGVPLRQTPIRAGSQIVYVVGKPLMTSEEILAESSKNRERRRQ